MSRRSSIPARSSLRRGVLWTVGAVVALVGAAISAFFLSPTPGALLVRALFERDATKTTKALEAHAPTGVTAIPDQRYRDGDDDAFLDVYFPESASQANPTVVWTHGGAWISGTRKHYEPYYQLLAAEGFTVVSLEYSLGPERKYPTAVFQLNDAHAYLVANAERLHIDPDRIVLAGDSAGAQLSSQLAALVTNPAYAARVGIEPALRPEQLRGVVLDCGIYEVTAMVGGPGIVGWGADRSVWAYTGDRDFGDSEAVAQMSSIRHVNQDFPPAYLSGGNGDPLTDTQSRPLADKLAELGVAVDTLFYPPDHHPALPHEYQFDLDTEDGRAALIRTAEFVRKVTG